MRYPPEHKAETIKKIVKNAGALAKKNGFGTTGVDDLMKAAGLTSGAFYKHFNSKEDLLEAVVEHEMGRTQALFFNNHGAQRDVTLTEIANQYLSMLHLAHPESGCLLPALSNEVARAGQGTQDQFTEGLLKLHQVLSGISEPQQAWIALSTAVGAISLARACGHAPTQKAILNACSEHLACLDSQNLK